MASRCSAILYAATASSEWNIQRPRFAEVSVMALASASSAFDTTASDDDASGCRCDSSVFFPGSGITFAGFFFALGLKGGRGSLGFASGFFFSLMSCYSS